MTKDDVAKAVREEIALFLRKNFDEVKPESTVADLGMDSLDCVESVMALEERFGIEISDVDAEPLQKPDCTVQRWIDAVCPMLGVPAATGG